MNAPTDLITRGGQTLTRFGWSSLEAAYRAAGLDGRMTVVQGSHKGGTVNASGSTHDRGDTADLRTRDLPTWAQADLCRVLVVELRRLGWCAWMRNQQHGGMSPHIHAVYRWADPPLSSGAGWQVREYDAGRNGLSSGGPDYHPRPPQSPYVPDAPPAPDERIPTVIVIRQGSRWRLVTGDRALGISETEATAFGAAGVPTVALSVATFDRFVAQLVAE